VVHIRAVALCVCWWPVDNGFEFQVRVHSEAGIFFIGFFLYIFLAVLYDYFFFHIIDRFFLYIFLIHLFYLFFNFLYFF